MSVFFHSRHFIKHTVNHASVSWIQSDLLLTSFVWNRFVNSSFFNNLLHLRKLKIYRRAPPVKRKMNVLEQLHAALVSVKVLRSSVGQVFDALGNGVRAEHGDDGRDTSFMLELQELLGAVNSNLR